MAAGSVNAINGKPTNAHDLTGTSVNANYLLGLEGVGGKLYFEQDCLIFKSHSFNIQVGEATIPYASITAVAPRKTMGIVPNGISVWTADGTEHKFVVNKRKIILAFLMERCGC